MEETKTNLFEGSPVTDPETQKRIEQKVNELIESNATIVQIRNYIENKSMEDIEKRKWGIFLKSGLPSFIVLIVSFFFDVGTVPILGNVADGLAKMIYQPEQIIEAQESVAVHAVTLWWFPLITYVLFMFFGWIAHRELKREIESAVTSERMIDYIIEKYTGIVDGIGTALPLLGAAILLISIKLGPTIFLGFSVPFEIKAIVILAMAKLFGGVFESLGLEYQAIVQKTSVIEQEYYHGLQEKMQIDLLTEIKESNERLFTKALAGGDRAASGFTKEDLQKMSDLVKNTTELNAVFTKNIVEFKNAAAGLTGVKIFDAEFSKQIESAAGSLKTIAHAVENSSKDVLATIKSLADTLVMATDGIKQSADYSKDYTVTLKESLESIRNIVAEINNIKLPDEKIMKELQMTAHFLNETINNLKDAAASKSLENLVYLAGKR